MGVIGILMIYLVTRRILVPVRQLTAAAQQVARGNLAQRIPIDRHDEIGKLAQSFNYMTRELEEAEAERQRMLADVAHELRTPLTNAQGYIEAIKDGVKSPDATTIDALHRQILQLHRLIDDLRLLSLAESGHLDLDLEYQNVPELLGHSVDAFAAKAQAKGVQLRLDSPPELHRIIADRPRLLQVIGNLMDNAIFHTVRGGWVKLSGRDTEDGVAIEVSDSGEGIPTEALSHIFDRLYRVENSRNRASGGSGLGLAIAKELVEAHCGTISVESEPGVGSRFTITLP